MFAPSALLWGIAAWVVATSLTLLVVAAVLVMLPSTYLREAPSRGRTGGAGWRPVVRIARNALGLVLVVAGAILSLPGIPGQGVLTLLIGLVLLDIPGCRRLGQRMMGRPGALARINRLRARFGRPPLLSPR